MTTRTARSFQRGNAVLVVMALLAMLSIGGLAIDLGRALHERRSAKTAADASAMAALQYVNDAQPGDRTGEFRRVAAQYATWNGLDPDHDPAVTLSVDPVVGYPGEAWKVTVTKQVPTSLLRLTGRRAILVSASAVAYNAPTSAGLVCLDPTADKCLQFRNSAKIHMHASTVFVNSNKSDALYVADNAEFSPGGPIQIVGGITTSGNGVVSGVGEGTTPAPQVHPDQIPFAYKNGAGPQQVNGKDVEPLAWLFGRRIDTGPNRQADTSSLQDGLGHTYKVQCGRASACNNTRLFVKTDNTHPVAQSGQAKKWPAFVGNCNPSYGCTAEPMARTTSDAESGDEVRLCPGVYFGGLTVRGAKVHLMTCESTYCQGNPDRACPPGNTNSVFIFAGGLRVTNRTTSVASNADSPTRLYGDGVTIYQGKNPGGGYGRITFDKNSDVDIKPPRSGLYKGISIYVDPDYHQVTLISARALGGIVGDIYARASNVVISGKRRDKCLDVNGKITTQNCYDFGQVGAGIVARRIGFGAGANDEGDGQCDTSCADADKVDDGTGNLVCPDCVASLDDPDTSDPTMFFQAGTVGGSGVQVVLGD